MFFQSLLKKAKRGAVEYTKFELENFKKLIKIPEERPTFIEQIDAVFLNTSENGSEVEVSSQCFQLLFKLSYDFLEVCNTDVDIINIFSISNKAMNIYKLIITPS
jgi:hypothetical protein